MSAGLAATAVSALLAAGAMGGERFTLFWSTIDGGGATYAHSARFMVAASIGQPDAGLADDGVPVFELQGGFFSEGFPLPAYGIFSDGFEPGDSRRWSAQVPAP